LLPKTADAVVIGGGVLGTSAAFHLANSGVQNIVLMDRGPIASGTTPFAAGQTGYLNNDRFALKFGAYCVEFFENFEKLTGQRIDFHQCGSFRVSLTEKYQADLDNRIAAAKELGDTVDMISHDRARQLVPTFNPPDGSQVLLIPRDGYVEPKSVAVAYAAAAVSRGVNIRTHINATGLDVANGQVKGVKTSEGVIETNWVVLAAGAWTRQFGQGLGLNLHTIPVRHQAYVTAPLPHVLSTQPIVRVTESQIYVRQEAAGLLVGGYGFRPLSFDMNEFPSDFEIPGLPADPVYFRQLADAATQFFPSLAEAVVIQERRGLPTVSPDGRLLVSESKQVRGLVVASACGVGGIDRSPGVGRVVADVVTGREPWLDPAVLNVERFGDEYAADAGLRVRCEHVYAHQYHDIY